MSKISIYVKILHLPGFAALAMPAVIGAISVGVFDFYSLVLLLCIGGFAVIYGFILNDYSDVELDRLVPELRKKPLVSGEIGMKTGITISLILIMLTFLFIFFLWWGKEINDTKLLSVLLLFFAGILGSIYNIYGKQIVGSDFLVAIALGFLFLFGALSVGIPTPITWIIFWLTFNQTLHMNAVEGGIKDIDHDFKMGVKNIALKSGVKLKDKKLTIPAGFKAFGLGIRLTSAILLFLPFFIFNYSYEIWHLFILAIATIIMLFYSYKLITLKEFNRNKIQRFIGIQSFLRYSCVPIMLITIIDIKIVIFLIFFPLLWYVILTILIKETLFKPRM